MKPGETVEQVRVVKEELGSIINKGENMVSYIVRIVADSYMNKVEEIVSVSYRGLPDCYILHTVDAYVEGLPEGEFWTEDVEEYEGLGEWCELTVSCKKHYWKWVNENSVVVGLWWPDLVVVELNSVVVGSQILEFFFIF
ncbi:hypothetical protein Hdeb2414_s0009g00325711 [Helianthus debilis subsp. tardiflorus]